MADYATIRLEEDATGIATLTLTRGDKHNALNAQMIFELTDAAAKISESDTIRAVVLTGEGKSFCAGGDLNWMREQMEKSVEARVAEGMTLATMLRAMDDVPKPLIAKVHGNAFGGGVGMMCICDIVIATPAVKWGLTETRLGLIPATIGPYVVRRLGEGHARRCFLNSKIFDAAAGEKFGLISDVVDQSQLDQVVEEEAHAFLNCAPGAVASAKSVAKHLARTGSDPIDYTAERLAERWADAECAEGVAAFFNKNKAPWMLK